MINEHDHKAFEDQQMDEFMRQSLDGYRINPDPGLWRGISRKLLWREMLRFNFKNLSTRGWITGATAVVLLGTALYLFIPENGVSHRTEPYPAPGKTAISKVSGSSHIVKTTISTAGNSNSVSPLHVETVNPPAMITSAPARHSITGNTSSSNSTMNQTGKTPTASLPSYNTPSAIAEVNPSIATPPETLGNHVNTLQQSKLERLSPNWYTLLYAGPYVDTIITIMTHQGPMLVRDSKPGKEQFFTASIGVLPERTFYTVPDTYSKMNYWVNGTFSYHISRFSLSTGLSLGYVFDEGKYKSEYRSLDSVGYYTSVVSFTVGQNNEVIYNTTISNIYDSLDHSGDYRTQNRFTYLQIPLLAGFRLADTKRMRLMLEAGPAVSFLIASRFADPVVYYENGRLIRLEEETPSRTNVNWQLWARMNLSFRVNRQFSFYLEPTGKFFLKSMIDPENTQKKDPWSLGLGFGIQYHFGNKAYKP